MDRCAIFYKDHYLNGKIVKIATQYFLFSFYSQRVLNILGEMYKNDKTLNANEIVIAVFKHKTQCANKC